MTMNMSNNISEKYNEIYKRKSGAFGQEPYPLVADILSFKRHGCVLDLGCGDGRNTLFLARNGFSVEAVDFARIGLTRIENCASRENLPIKIRFADIRKDMFLDCNFDIVLMTFVSQYLTSEELVILFQKVQKYTRPGGLHAVAVIDEDSEYAKSKKAARWYFPETKDIEFCYKGWEILRSYKSRGKILSRGYDCPVDHGEVIASNFIFKKP